MNIQDLIKQKKAYYKYFTESESLEAVKQDGDALRFVKESHLNIVEEMTLSEICAALGKAIKIVK